MLLLSLQANAQDRQKVNALLAEAQEALATGLQQAPVAPNMWLSLARLRSLTTRPDEQAMRYLENSYLTGPRENWVSPQRLSFVLANWDSLSPAVQEAATRELRDQTAARLGELTLGRSPAVVELIEREISTRPEPAQRAFERARKRIDKGVL